MQRLNHVLPEWTRVQWTSIENKNKYAPILNSIIAAWREIERMSVVHDIRSSALDSVTSAELPSLIEKYKTLGVLVVPLSKEGTGVMYSSVAKEPTEGQPYNVRVAFTKSEELAAEWFHIWNNVDASTRDRRVGELLGFPDCCIEFFDEYWNKKRFLDTTWPMSRGDMEYSDEVKNPIVEVSADSPIETNILWRWQGVRATFHLPCSFNCGESVSIGKKNIALGRQLGYNKEMDWVEELLSWPVEWSALHGIAEIKTPINKISTRTDMTPWKYTVRKLSVEYPEDGMSGTVYPYNQKRLKIHQLTKSRSFLKSLEDSSVWEENGFSNKEAMDHFHDVIIDAIGPMKYIPAGKVLDLGCGNGFLLGRIVAEKIDLEPHGVEMNRQRCMSAATTIHWGVFTMGNAFDLSTWAEPAYSLVLLMPGRLLEVSEIEAKALRKQLYDKTDLVLINLTCDWTSKYGNIENIMKITNLDNEWEPAGELIHRGDDMAQLFKRKV